MPVWLYALGGAAAVAASVPAAALADARIGSRLGRNLYRPGSERLVRALRILGLLLLVEIVAAGLFGPEEFAANPATVLVWVDLWVGLGLVAAIFAAHRIALEVVSRRRAAVWVQAPLIVLMIAYTVLGLWILGQAYASG